MDPLQKILDLLDEASAAVADHAGPDDVDRVAQFGSHLATCRMVVSELHGTPASDQE